MSLPALGTRAIFAALATVTSAGIAVAGAAPATAAATPAGISFLTAPPAAAVVGGQYTVRVRGGGATAPVELDTQDATVCSVSASVVTFVAAGTCLIEAHQDADPTHAAADSAQLVDVEAAPPTNVVAPVAVDKVAPTIVIVGVRAGAAYRGAGPHARCQASDSVSGVARCSLTSTRSGHVVTVRARALDHAGNASQAVLRYRVHTG